MFFHAPGAATETNDKGFTLIELMVVIVILSILAVYMAPRLVGRDDQARQLRAKVDIEALETALKLYRLDTGRYPTTQQGMEALVEQPEGVANWREGGYLEKKRLLKDPWGNDYVYLSPGTNGDFDIISYGADGQPGGEGVDADIKSWELE
ncbi:MAG: type II secretion system major pseudopilin GspG [Desulfosalsimonadaceae bacterium]